MGHNKKAVIAAMGAMGLFAALVGGNASAVTMVTLAGTNVDYTFDQEDLGLFGTASVLGGSLVFTPTNFAATSDGSPAATHLINVTVSAHTGYQLTAFNLNEEGGYSLAGEEASAYVSGYLGALDIEGNTSNYLNSNLQPSLSNGTWSASAGVTLPATGWGGADGIVGSVSIAISNDLFADSGSGSSASIYKDFVGITAITAPVPEAETYAMMLAGLGLVGFMVRRRSRAAA